MVKWLHQEDTRDYRQKIPKSLSGEDEIMDKGYLKRGRISLVGIGMGTEESLTKKAEDIIGKADIIIGATRLIQSVYRLEVYKKRIFERKPPIIYTEYKPALILKYLDSLSLTESQRVVIVLSGDIGFCSGARKLYEQLVNYEVEMIPGISTISYFASCLKIPWENIKLCSLHGVCYGIESSEASSKTEGLVTESIVHTVYRNQYTFALLGGENSVNELCKRLREYGLTHVKLYVGERLSYEDEKVQSIQVDKGYIGKQSSLAAVIIENREACTKITEGIADEEFIRGKVPMTKSEVRAVSISKLGLCKDSICYDVGAGTGSVGIEMAMKSPDIRVYAIESNPEGVELIQANRKKFFVDNLIVVEGLAPKVLQSLPAPTHVFIGGTKGNLEEIVETVWSKNLGATIVINAISLETVSQAITIEKKYADIQSEVVQMQVSRAKEMGSYHLMVGENPIYMIKWMRRNK